MVQALLEKGDFEHKGLRHEVSRIRDITLHSGTHAVLRAWGLGVSEMLVKGCVFLCFGHQACHWAVRGREFAKIIAGRHGELNLPRQISGVSENRGP